MDMFGSVELAPADPIYGLMEAFSKDERQDKINLGIGVYKDSLHRTPLMEAVKLAEEQLVMQGADKVYLPIDGDQRYCEEAADLVFGEGFCRSNQERFVGIQTTGGTGALRFGGDFLKRAGVETIYLSDPTWANHKKIFSHAGLELKSYPYYDKERRSLSFDAMMEALKGETKEVAILLHAVCHNPSGCDLSLDQWGELADLIEERGFIPFFDLAYLGFGEGIEEDARAVRLFAERGIPFFLALSFSKNFNLYGERVGALFFYGQNPDVAAVVKSQLKQIVRGCYSSPSIHGAAIVREVLGSVKLRELWVKELTAIRLRIQGIKRTLSVALRERIPEEDFSFIEKSHGMFCFTGLLPTQVDALREEFGIYMTQDGRMNLAGLNEENLKQVAVAISKVKRR